MAHFLKKIKKNYYSWVVVAHIYNSRLVNYDHRDFIRLATGDVDIKLFWEEI